MPTLLMAAAVATVEVAAGSRAAGKLIRELELRTQTGATIAVIQRGDREIVNPGPDAELRSGDKVLLLGMPPQIEAAKLFLTAPAGTPPGAGGDWHI